ncbi:hypothetical protein, partial [Thiomonas delicata]|uniref:hypothetical protein n=1 Tax=Thiomonas delicata TaxID=364030 RepID=UPI001644DB40
DAITLPPDVPTPFGQHELIASSRELLDDTDRVTLDALGFAHDDNAAQHPPIGELVANRAHQRREVGLAVGASLAAVDLEPCDASPLHIERDRIWAQVLADRGAAAMDVHGDVTLDGLAAPIARASFGIGIEVMQELGFCDRTEASRPAANHKKLGPQSVFGIGHIADPSH